MGLQINIYRLSVEIVTREDLEMFRKKLPANSNEIVDQSSKKQEEPVEGFKTSHVRKFLGCSVNKLVSPRNLRTKK